MQRDDLRDVERGKALFEAYLLAHNWPSAALILNGLPRVETVPERARLVRALGLLAGKLRGSQPRLAERWERLAADLDGD